MTRTEEQTKKTVVDQMTSNGQVNATDVRMQVSDAHLTLRVTLPSSLARGIAANDAMNVAKVLVVDNQLEVDVPLPAVEDPPTDEHLENQIRVALSQFLRRCGSELQVAVNDGTATVTGTVRSLWLKIRVGSIVSEIAGVRDFANDVEVIPENPVSDEVIVKKILETLEMYEWIDAGRIEVEAKGGVVTLLGSVPTHSAKQAVCNAVLNKAGVRDLRNNLQTIAS